MLRTLPPSPVSPANSAAGTSRVSPEGLECQDKAHSPPSGPSGGGDEKALQRLADAWECSTSEAMGRLIREETARREHKARRTAKAGDFIAQERDATLGTVAGLENTRRACWGHACRHDGIEPGSLFVVFSEGNPYVPFLERIEGQLADARSALTNFGYGGLVLDGGKAQLRAPAKKRRGEPAE
jgi:hypothetical protein